ncbi:hypothetical protein EVAR_245_1 [Eumeta japonica]|uniref:Integrase catalytic domain-containing protein n=1 Tax=Eumeta variegata TaxID=151549 RepID=A0A4C1SBJ5_EUMVA|nr:hypothetical protein EVAR_245_1 [Eumeta japonica]
MPKANFGNTNDGNTSRRFFEDPKLSSDITGTDYELIYRLRVILETISSGYEINLEKYEKYAEETACLYVKLYPWHPMTPTLHKVLVHGSDIIKNALLPIGQLSEKAAEARNKHFRSYRQDYSRKFSRESCNRAKLIKYPYVQRLHADFTEYQGKHYLVVDDAHTNWIEVSTMAATNAKSVISEFRKLFTRFGLPLQRVTDNGPLFDSSEIKNYIIRNAIAHCFTSPYGP